MFRVFQEVLIFVEWKERNVREKKEGHKQNLARSRFPSVMLGFFLYRFY